VIGVRAGSKALSLLSVPLNVQMLTAMAEEKTISLMTLRRMTGTPPQTTMRGRIRTFSEMNILTKRSQSQFAGSVDLELTRTGRDLVEVAEQMQAWLNLAPDFPVELGTPSAKSTIGALSEAWSATIVRALAARPLSLTELNSLLRGITYPSLERRLAALRHSGQIEVCAANGGRTPYRVTAWLRRAVAPLLSAVRWERSTLGRSAPPITALDVEAILLLAIPLVELPVDLSGTCRLAVELRDSLERPSFAGVRLVIRDGRLASCSTRLEGDVDAWASCNVSTLSAAILAGDTTGMEIGGDGELARSLIDGVHQALLRPDPGLRENHLETPEANSPRDSPGTNPRWVSLLR
jgi:DNA-binding HxlR family transcriptional regulator